MMGVTMSKVGAHFANWGICAYIVQCNIIEAGPEEAPLFWEAT